MIETIMGDGTVALILDVMGLAVAAGLAGEMRDQSHPGAGFEGGEGHGRQVGFGH